MPLESFQILQDALNHTSNIFQWQIRRRYEIAEQIYGVGSTLIETKRRIITEHFTTTIFVKNNKGYGEATFSWTPGQGRPDSLLRLAYQAARQMANPPFQLPEAQTNFPQLDICDHKALEKPRETLQSLHESLIEASCSQKKVRLASSELFLNHHTVNLLNSRDFFASYDASSFYIDFALLAGSGQTEAESLCSYNRRLAKDIHIEDQIALYTRYGLDSLVAGLPETGVFDIVFSEEALDTLFSFFTYQCNAESNFSNKASVKCGGSILGSDRSSQGETLSLFADNTLPGAMGSAPFDKYGLPGTRTCLIKENIFQNLWGSLKYATYLGIPATGEIGNIEIGTGEQPMKELLTYDNRPVYHLLRFSTFTPNRVTGAFSGEIRTGYRIDKTGKHPIRGGSVSGHIQDAFQNAHYSKEKGQRETYFGPMGVRLSNVTLSGK